MKNVVKVNVVDKIDEMSAAILNVRNDAAKFDGGNNAAGTRVRVGMQEVKKLAQDVRNLITEVKSNR